MRKKSRSQKVFLNIVIKLVYQIVVMITGLITPRLILQTFGSAYNGAISSISQFLGISAILTAGIGGAMRTELYKTLAVEDVFGTSKIVKATELIFKRVGRILLVYSGLLAVIFPIVIKGQIPWTDAILLVFIITITTFGEYYFGQTYYLLLEADQTDYIVTIVRIFTIIANTVVAVVLIRANTSILMVKFCSSLVYLIPPIFTYLFVRKKYKLQLDCEADISMLPQRKAATFHSLANVVHDKTDVTLLTIFTNVRIVSVYTVYSSIVTNIKQIMYNLTSSLEGGFGSMWAKGEKDLFKKHFSTYEFLLYSFSSVVFTCVGLLLLDFVKLYTAGITDINYIIPSFAFLLTITEAILCIREPYLTIVQAAGKYEETKRDALIEAGLNVGVSIVLVNVIGLNGVIIGTLVANAYRTVKYAYFSSRRLLNRPFSVFAYRLFWHLLNSLLTCLGYRIISQYFAITTWLEWIRSGAICFVIALLVTVLSARIFYKSDLLNAIAFLKRITQKA